ncbi:MAG: stage II sporulation protein R [Ruminococcaceae bacterium]|nr:stage II sporulation protein R [Oscillospiraceae bacterium]
MKKAILPTICILLCTLCIVFIPTEAEAAIYEDTVRLHILAPSDSIEDQTLKLKIRDKILLKYGSALSGSESVRDTEALLNKELSNIENDCNKWIRELDFDYSAKVTLCDEWYNTREYADFTLPAGVYTSLKITIDSGKGQNWWCVMYPPMCLDASLGEETTYSTEEKKLITGDKYRVKFKLLEVTSELFKKRR